MSELVAYLVLFGVALAAGFGGGLAFALLFAWKVRGALEEHVERITGRLDG